MQVGRLEIELLANVARLSRDMDRARGITGGAMDQIERRVQMMARTVAASAAAAGAAFTAWAMGMSRSMDATLKMAEQIGTTTEALTGLRYAAQQMANVSDGTFDMALRRMTRRIAEAAEGGGAAAKALEELGLNARQLSNLSVDEQFLRLADAMQKTERQGSRLRHTMAIFDTEGMPLVNALSQGSAEIQKFVEEAERFGLVVSTDAARAASDFQTEISRLQAMLSGLSVGLANEVLPTLNDFISRAMAAATETGGLHDEIKALTGDSALKQWFDAGLVGFARIADVAVFLAKAVGVVGGAFRSVAADAEVAVAAMNKAQIWNWGSEEASQQLQDALTRRNAIVGKFNTDLSDLATYEGNRFEQAALASINTIKVQSDAVKLIDLTLEEASKSADKNTKATKANAAALTEAQRAAQAFRKEQERSLAAQYQSVSAIHQQAQGLEDQVALFGLGKTALEDLTIARLEEQAVLLRGFDGSQETVEAIEREIEARQRLRTAIGSMEKKEAERAAWEDWARDVEQIFNRVGQSLTDAIFDGGKSGKELLKDVFKGLTFNVLINPVMGALQGWVTNQLGGMFGYQNPQQGGGMLGYAQHANTLNTLGGGIYQAMTGASVGASNLSLGYANLVGMTGGDSIGALISANGGWEGALSGLSSATSAAVTAGALSAAPTVAASLSTSFGTAATTMASTSFTASLGGGAAAGAAGGAAAGGGLMAGLSAAAPWIAGGLAVASAFGLFDDREPTTRHGQRTAVGLYGGEYQTIASDSRQAANTDSVIRQMMEEATSNVDRLFTAIGVDAAIDSLYALTESSIKGDRQGVASGGQLRIDDQLRDFGEAWASDMTIRGFGGWSEAEMIPRLAMDLQVSMLEAFQRVAEADQLPSVLAEMIEGIYLRGLDEAQLGDLATRFNAVIEQVGAFQTAVEMLPFANLRDLSFDAAANLIKFAGGLENLDAGMSTYFQNFYSDAERLEWATDQMGAAFENLGLSMPDVAQGADAAKAAYRDLVESLDMNTESGQEAYAVLMTLSGGFAELATGIEALDGALDLSQEVNNILRERGGLERQLLAAMGDTAALRRLDLAALDISNRALQEQIWAVDKQNTVNAQRYDLETQLLNLQGDTITLRARELSVIDPANRALKEQIWTLQDAAQAQQAYQQSVQSFSASLQSVSNSISGVRENILLDQLGTDEAKYGYFKTQADQLAQLIPNLTDADAITRAMSQISSLTSRAYGTLDQEQKLEMGGEFLDYLNRTEDIAIRQIEIASREQSNANAKAVGDAVDAAMSKMLDALARMLNQSGKDSKEAAELVRAAAAQFKNSGTQIGGGRTMQFGIESNA